jgi:hypothetical protein
MHDRYFFHSFPRPRTEESETATLERGLHILAFMKEIGLVLAPEVVIWNTDLIGGGTEKFAILQRRACFTELEISQLAKHSAVFGPISLAFDIGKLRAVGATPVIYAPQGLANNPLSQISTFSVRGAYHTRYVLERLLELKEASDPETAIKKFGYPLAPDCKIFLKNPDPTGKIVAEYEVPASNVNHLMQHIGFRNIPFDHSIGVLSIFLNMFYPTDNSFTGDQLGYYRQREWRLIGGPNINGRPMGRMLNDNEISQLSNIDTRFWNREIDIPTPGTLTGGRQRRALLALVYDPVENFNFFDLVDAVFVPKEAEERARAVVGDKVVIRE